MHPIERLRYVARAAGDGSSMLVREAAGALASFSSDPTALVTACRRLVDRQPTSAALWWLAARVLGSAEPGREAWAALNEIEEDETATQLRDLLPDDASVLVLGWPEITAATILRRGDLEVFVVDALDEGAHLVRRLERSGCDPLLVSERGVGAAAAEVDIVVLEAVGLGPSGLVCVPGSRAAAAVARHAGNPVWVVAGAGRVLPGRLWEAYVARLEDIADPWDADAELVPIDLVDVVVGPNGSVAACDAHKRADCPVAPELLRTLR